MDFTGQALKSAYDCLKNLCTCAFRVCGHPAVLKRAS